MENTFHGNAFGKLSKDHAEISGKLSKDGIERFGKDKEQKSNYNEPEYTGNDWANERLATDKEQIEKRRHNEVVELAGIIENKMRDESYIFSDVAAIDAADEILNLGYHKTVWHKVSQNDLPTRQGQKVWLCTTSKDYFMANYYDDTPVGGKQFFEVASVGRITLSNVLVWMELPKYEE